MAKMQMPNPKEISEGYSISDPCCGAGCLLIAMANELDKTGKKESCVFYAQDIDYTTALMCYIQLSLLGVKAYVKIGDSLASPFTEGEKLTENIWLTPAMFSERSKDGRE